jgi:beta-mannanase
VVTWEPWLTDFENRLHEKIPLRDARDRGGLAAIGRGEYDFYVDAWARAAKEYGHTIMLRFAHEMNDPYRYPWGPQNNPPQDFIAAWRHVVDRFRAAGATNVLFVWAPHLAYEGWEHYWPGDEYVDWVATGALNYGTVAYWSKWWTFDQIFGQHYASLAGLKKPIMIAEFGSVSVGGDRAKWYAEALGSLRDSYPQVKALMFFNVHADRTVTYQAIDWSIERDTAVLRVVREQAVAHPADK